MPHRITFLLYAPFPPTSLTLRETRSLLPFPHQEDPLLDGSMMTLL